MKRDFVSPLPSSESVAGASGVLVPQILVEEPARHLEALGEASSHPRFAIRRLAVFQLACVGLAGLLIGAMALIWLLSFRPDGIIDAVLRFPEWFDSQARKVVVISVVLGFFLSARLAGTLQIRGSFWGALAERKGGSGLLGKSVAGAVFLCFAAGLPYIVASQSSWRFALLLDLVALAPLPLLVAAMEWGIAAQRDESPGSRTTRLTVTIGMIGLVVAPFIVFQLASGFLRVDFAKWVASYSSAIDLSAFVEAGALKSSAPAWLRGCVPRQNTTVCILTNGDANCEQTPSSAASTAARRRNEQRIRILPPMWGPWNEPRTSAKRKRPLRKRA